MSDDQTPITEPAPPPPKHSFRTSDETAELYAALSLAQGDISNPEKNQNNPHYNSDYSDLAAVLSVIRPAFATHGLALIQIPFTDAKGRLCVVTRVAHKSGQWIDGVLRVTAEGTGRQLAQETAAITTYLRRIGAAGPAAVAQQDKDGEDISDGAQPKPPPRRGGSQRTRRPPGTPAAPPAAPAEDDAKRERDARVAEIGKQLEATVTDENLSMQAIVMLRGRMVHRPSEYETFATMILELQQHPLAAPEMLEQDLHKAKTLDDLRDILADLNKEADRVFDEGAGAAPTATKEQVENKLQRLAEDAEQKQRVEKAPTDPDPEEPADPEPDSAGATAVVWEGKPKRLQGNDANGKPLWGAEILPVEGDKPMSGDKVKVRQHSGGRLMCTITEVIHELENGNMIVGTERDE